MSENESRIPANLKQLTPETMYKEEKPTEYYIFSCYCLVDNIKLIQKLSINRTAGLITFSHVADVDIPLTQTDTCAFVDSVGELVYTKGGTSILVALNLAVDEIKENAIHNTTLVFLITDGISTTDPTPAADTLKANGDIVFTIGIADYQRDQLEPLATVSSDGTPNFFGVSSFEVFLTIAQYLNTTYIDQSQINCN
ncbi:sushi, von Willebrand factor type A, EGF and pentraxin domain-containing protein 1-like [Schistocerca americana]|uniref:sushi, von Willebrand factor type A, EGF and pentraxin domain-containing protein 1-like n=1 Tax=Schistocerca americana TaxID=7009 RepID=UPI001F4F3526|nr:sushi, von Willebrand factor type A, EGF and pentraxin domain-containing protein 1-like [Schistocerca americana]